MKKRFILVLVFSAVMLAGCVELTEISDEQRHLMAQYAAGVLLKHDKFYEEKLVTPTPTPVPTKAPTATPTEVPAPTDPGSLSPTSGGKTGPGEDGNRQALAELKDVIGVEGIELEYGGYEMYESYTFDSYSVEPSSPGKLLMIAKILVENTTDLPVTLKLTDKDLTYRLYVDGDNYLKPKMSILMNDFTTLDIVLDGGRAFESVLVFEVDRDLEPSRLNLFIIQDNKTVIVELK